MRNVERRIREEEEKRRRLPNNYDPLLTDHRLLNTQHISSRYSSLQEEHAKLVTAGKRKNVTEQRGSTCCGCVCLSLTEPNSDCSDDSDAGGGDAQPDNKQAQLVEETETHQAAATVGYKTPTDCYENEVVVTEESRALIAEDTRRQGSSSAWHLE